LAFVGNGSAGRGRGFLRKGRDKKSKSKDEHSDKNGLSVVTPETFHCAWAPETILDLASKDTENY